MFHPLTSRLIMIAGLFAVLALAGCGGGGSGVENTLRQERDMLQDEVEDLETKLEDAQDDLKEAEEAKTDAEGQVSDAAEDLAEAESDAADAIAAAQRARDEARRQAQTLEANQRAENLKKAFLSVTTTTDLTEIGLSVTAPTQSSLTQSSLRLTRGGHGNGNGSISRISNRSGSWIRSRTMALTSGADSGKTVVYTDRELGRPLLEHFGQYRDSAVPAQIDADQTGGAMLVNLEHEHHGYYG